MQLNEYQLETAKFAVYPPAAAKTYLITGLASEAGELLGHVAKAARGDVRYRGPRELEKNLLKELGDILWFTARLAAEVGYTLEDVAVVNLDKLSSRAARGTIKGDGDER